MTEWIGVDDEMPPYDVLVWCRGDGAEGLAYRNYLDIFVYGDFEVLVTHWKRPKAKA